MKKSILLSLSIFVLITLPIGAKKIKNSFYIGKETKLKNNTPKNLFSGRNIVLTDTLHYSEEGIKSLYSVKFSGYDKEVNSYLESFIITNPSEFTITGYEVRIDYLDLQDRLLHSKNVKELCEIPPKESRRIDIKSWDTQHTFYYYLGNEPKKVATPFKVIFTPISFWLSEER